MQETKNFWAWPKRARARVQNWNKLGHWAQQQNRQTQDAEVENETEFKELVF